MGGAGGVEGGLESPWDVLSDGGQERMDPEKKYNKLDKNFVTLNIFILFVIYLQYIKNYKCHTCMKGILEGFKGLPGPSKGFLGPAPAIKPKVENGPPCEAGSAPIGPPGPRARPGGGP